MFPPLKHSGFSCYHSDRNHSLCSLPSAFRGFLKLKNGSIATHILWNSSSHTAKMFHQRAILPDLHAIYRYLYLGPLWPAVNLKIQSLNYVVCACILAENEFPMCYFYVRRQEEITTSFLLFLVFFFAFFLLQFLGEVRSTGKAGVFAWLSGWTWQRPQAIARLQEPGSKSWPQCPFLLHPHQIICLLWPSIPSLVE